MGFFSRIKNKARRQVAPVMPMPPRKTMENAPRAMDEDRMIRGPGLNPREERTIEGIPISQLPFNPRMPGKLFPFPRIPKSKKRGGLAAIIRRLQEQLRNQQMPQPIPERMPISNAPSFNPTIFGQPIGNMDFSQMPQISPEDMRNLQIPTEMPVMSEERMAPPVMNQMQGEPRMMMAAGGASVAGRALSQRFKNPSKAVLGVRGRNLPDRMMPGIGDRILGSPGRGQPGGLTYGARDLNRIRNTENAIMAGGGLGVAGMIDATNMFSEPASVDNISFMSPEAMGTDLANLRVGIDRVIDLARNKASEMGADINEYVDRTRSAYDQQMENQRMQELDAEQGMQPFSLLMGPDMPLFRPEETDPRVDRMIGSGMGSSESLDDILSDLEKKN